MFVNNRLKNLRSASATHRDATHRLTLEALDDRCLPSTFTVTNLLDAGPNSLRAAVTSANANPGPDAIDFATTGTITLTSGQLSITDSLTISGPGVNALTVSGLGRVSAATAPSGRVFGIAGNPTVSIANLTVANGWTFAPGGGIYMAGGTLTLDHCTVAGNYAIGAGGGIYVAGGTLTLNQSTVAGNYAENYSGGGALGGGLFVAGGTLTLDQSTVAWNYAVGSPGYYNADVGYYGGPGEGGGLYVADGMVSINRSSVYSNSAVGGDGADDSWSDPFYARGGDGGGAKGGGIRVAGGTLEVRQSTFGDNRAVGGAAGSGAYYPYNNGSPGVGEGGGFFISSYIAIPYLDTFTADHTVGNSPDNIVGPYFLYGMPMLAISDVTVLEGNTGTTNVVFTVRLSAASGQAVTVAYATADATATAAGDYTAASGTLTFAPGETSKAITVLVNGDRLAEPNETFSVNLSSATNANIADGQGPGTIVDDEPRIRIGDVTTTEGNSGTTPLIFTVTLSAASDVPVTVGYATANGTATAGSDYQAASGTVTIPVGQTSGTITVLVNGDRLGEPDETFGVNLSNPVNAGIADDQGVGTILDNEPHIRIGDATKKEGRNNTTLFMFTVTLSAAYDQAVTMLFGTVDGTAKTSDSDYVAKTGTLTFAPGETTKTITIEVKGDSKREANETFAVELFGASGNASLLDPVGLGTILNDD